MVLLVGAQLGARVDDLADLAGAQESLRGHIRHRVTGVLGDHEVNVGRCCLAADLLCFAVGGGHWLFDDEVLAGVDDGRGRRDVCVVRQDEVDHVHRRIGEDLAERIPRFGVVFGRERLRLVTVDVADSDQVHEVVELPVGCRVRVCDEAESDDGDPGLAIAHE